MRESKQSECNGFIHQLAVTIHQLTGANSYRTCLHADQEIRACKQEMTACCQHKATVCIYYGL